MILAVILALCIGSWVFIHAAITGTSPLEQVRGAFTGGAT